MNGTQKVESSRFWMQQIMGNANFTSPQPTGAMIAAAANQLEAAILAARGGGPEDTATRRLREEELDNLLRQFRAYVESTANANPTEAEAIILSAGLQVRNKSVREVRDVEAMLTGNPGEIRVQHRGVIRATFEFQISTDISKEENWSTFYCGTRGRVTTNNLTPKVLYYFRVRVTSRNGRSAWSEVVSVYLPA